MKIDQKIITKYEVLMAFILKLIMLYKSTNKIIYFTQEIISASL